MEQIYTIPVNEAFEAGAADASCGCAFCALYRKLEENELDLILGASMMFYMLFLCMSISYFLTTTKKVGATALSILAVANFVFLILFGNIFAKHSTNVTSNYYN